MKNIDDKLVSALAGILQVNAEHNIKITEMENILGMESSLDGLYLDLVNFVFKILDIEDTKYIDSEFFGNIEKYTGLIPCIDLIHDIIEERTSQLIKELDLSYRIKVCFKILNIKTIADIAKHAAREFYLMRNIGKKSFKRIERILEDNGLNFKPRTHKR